MCRGNDVVRDFLCIYIVCDSCVCGGCSRARIPERGGVVVRDSLCIYKFVTHMCRGAARGHVSCLV